MGSMFRQQINAYFAVPPAQRRAELDRQIDQEELMRKAGLGAAFTQSPFTFYMAAAVLYLAMTGALTLGMRAAEIRASRGLARA
jgi:ABC-type arginine/histidine transport system permease subunit